MNSKGALVISTLTLGILSAATVTAAERQFLRDTTAGVSLAAKSTASNTTQAAEQLVGLSGDNTLRVRKVLTDRDGATTTRYQQYYKGIPVLGDDVVIARRASGAFKLAHGAVLAGIAADVADVTARISKDKAVQIAKATSAPAASGALGEADGAVSFSGETSRLGIWQSPDGKARLVYEISYVQHGATPSRPLFIVDATSGAVLHHFDNLQTADATGPGGNEKTGIYYYGTDFASLDVTQSGNTCTMDNTNVRTINLNGGTSGSAAYSFTCPENTYKAINGAYSPLNDAHFFGGVIFNMYQDWIGVAPLTFQLKMKVHYSRRYENAFWDGSSMTFGDGFRTFYPLVSLDVSAHEVSHGFTEQNSNLVYAGKSGGLNEAFSDMAGEAAEYYMNGSNDWLVGAQIFKGAGALRYMNNPPQDGQSIDHQADYRSGMDVHYSSGVYNKAFYNLATTAGWDTQKAFQVYARANSNYWTANVDWDQAGNGVMDAACDLGFDVDQVQGSLVAVGVSSSVSPGSDCSTTSNPPPTALFAETCTDLNCSFDASGSSDDGSIVSYSWNFGDGSGGVGVNAAHSYAAAGSYNVSLEVTDDLGATGTISRVVTVTGASGGPDPIDVTIDNVSVARRAFERFTVELAEGYSSLNVTTSGGTGNVSVALRLEGSSASCISKHPGNDESCTVANPAAGTWSVEVFGVANSAGVTVHYTASP